MSKIEEMAEKAFSFGTEYSDLCRRSGYIKGANAVLRKIEKALDLGEPPYLISTEQAYYQAIQKIKGLKGK